MTVSDYLIKFSDSEVNAIRAKWQDETLGNKALSDVECDGGIDLCRRYGAHPLRNQMIPMKFFDRDKKQSTLTWITSIDMMRVGAHRTESFAGMDDFEREYTESGSLIGCRTHVYRMVKGVRCSFPGVAIWDELFSDKGLMAKKMPLTWIDKCAEASGLRRAFPLECGNLYLREELKQAAADAGEDDGTPPPTSREVPQRPDKTTSMEATTSTAAKPAPKPEPKPKPASFVKADLVAMVGRWSGAHPDEHLEVTKRLVEAKGLKGVQSKDDRFQAFCAAVRDAMEANIAYADFAGLTPAANPQTEEEIAF